MLVELGGVDPPTPTPDLAHDVRPPHRVGAPRYLSRDEVPADDVERERAIFEAHTRNEGKPEAALAKIVDGRLNGCYKETVLLEQPFVQEPKQTVGQLVGQLGADATVGASPRSRSARTRTGPSPRRFVTRRAASDRGRGRDRSRYRRVVLKLSGEAFAEPNRLRDRR